MRDGVTTNEHGGIATFSQGTKIRDVIKWDVGLVFRDAAIYQESKGNIPRTHELMIIAKAWGWNDES